VQVKATEITNIGRLEDALDLGADDATATRLAWAAMQSLAGGADVAVVACARGALGRMPRWASDLGVVTPVVSWVRGLRSTTEFGRVELVPSSPREHEPGRPFILFQDECVAQLAARGMRRSTAYQVIGAFAEMADNATEHSRSPVPPFSTFEVTKSWWEFSVTDFGVGIPESLRTNPRYSNLNDREAVQAALRDGVSRLEDGLRGTGYGSMMRALAEHECITRLRTGSVVARWSGRGIGSTDLTYELVGARPGLHVRVVGQL
jgi:hypothetical protein